MCKKTTNRYPYKTYETNVYDILQISDTYSHPPYDEALFFTVEKTTAFSKRCFPEPSASMDLKVSSGFSTVTPQSWSRQPMQPKKTEGPESEK